MTENRPAHNGLVGGSSPSGPTPVSESASNILAGPDPQNVGAESALTQCLPQGYEDDSPPTYDMSIHTNPDAMAWTKFFRECNPDCNVPDDTMIGWFSNAMMAMHDFIRGGPVVLPDGSAFFVAEVPTEPTP